MLTNMAQMSRTRRSLRDTDGNSPEGSDEDDLRSPVSEMGEPISPVASRGRKGTKRRSDADSLQIRKEDIQAMDVMH